jgi:hypothetical protein
MPRYYLEEAFMFVINTACCYARTATEPTLCSLEDAVSAV